MNQLYSYGLLRHLPKDQLQGPKTSRSRFAAHNFPFFLSLENH
jgi:hypothetical protein